MAFETASTDLGRHVLPPLCSHSSTVRRCGTVLERRRAVLEGDCSQMGIKTGRVSALEGDCVWRVVLKKKAGTPKPLPVQDTRKRLPLLHATSDSL